MADNQDRMDRSDQGRVCPECGVTLREGSDCRICAEKPHGIGLKVLPTTPGEALGASQVKLVRRLKMSTVDRLAADPRVEKLPETLGEVEQALAAGDLAGADRILDAALGTVLQGPGHEKRTPGWGFLPLVLWIWCGILAVLLALSFLM